jgi:cytochrome c2
MKFFKYLLPLALCAACGSQEETTREPAFDEQPAKVMSAGERTFVNNCIQCHSVHKDKVGPKLENILARWDNDTARIGAFIKNSQEVIKKGDPRAVKVYEEWHEALMTPMPHLTDSDIKDILTYIYSAEAE